MSTPLFLGTDIGTQGTKTVLTDAAGQVLGSAFVPSALLRGADGSVTEDPAAIFDSVIRSVREAVENAGLTRPAVVAMGIDGQMSGIMGIGAAFDPVGPLDSWLDNRCAPDAALIREQAEDVCVRQSGGQVIHSHAARILRIRRQEPERYARTVKFVMPNGFVAGRLCGLRAEQAFMDYTYLHFNNFADTVHRCFDGALLAHFGVAADKLPRICTPTEPVGTVLPVYAEAMGLGNTPAVIAGCGDTAASSLGAGIVEPGLAYDVAGTASVFACCTDRFAPDTGHRTVLFSRSVIDGLYLPLSYVTGGGLTLPWFSELVHTDLPELDRLAAAADSRVLFLPHLSGRTFPPEEGLDGVFAGITPLTGKGELFRAVMEAIAFEYKGYLSVMRSTGCIDRLKAVRCVGGGAKSAVFCGIKADVLGADYHAAGALRSAPQTMALLVAYATGHTRGELAGLFACPEDAAPIRHDPARHAAYEKQYSRYTRLLETYIRYQKEDV